jgi:flavin reductase (DIM6/NTAB) family NADH-FMN oxidoreductase RutF
MDYNNSKNEGEISMEKTATEDIGKFSHHYPKLAAIITASSGGKDNAMTAAWHSSISINPPIYGVSISPKRFTCQLIRESKEFGINFIPFEKAHLAASIGGTPGQKIDKFQKLNIPKEKPIKIGVPLLKDAYASYECKLLDSKIYGDHAWVVREIVGVHFQKEIFTENEMLDLGKVKPLLYLGSEFYATVDKDSLNFIKRGV